jgi:hypothetical protein
MSRLHCSGLTGPTDNRPIRTSARSANAGSALMEPSVTELWQPVPGFELHDYELWVRGSDRLPG